MQRAAIDSAEDQTVCLARITLDIYSHVTASLHSDAAERVAGLIFGQR
jgi:hypothetical protein